MYYSGQHDFVPLPEEALTAFMHHCEQKIGEATFRTPRTTITAFIGLLAVLEQNPGSRWESLLGQMVLTADVGHLDRDVSDELVSLSL